MRRDFPNRVYVKEARSSEYKLAYFVVFEDDMRNYLEHSSGEPNWVTYSPSGWYVENGKRVSRGDEGEKIAIRNKLFWDGYEVLVAIENHQIEGWKSGGLSSGLAM